MPVIVARTVLMDAGFVNRINKTTDIIGMDSLGLNLLIEVKAPPTLALPDMLTVKIEVKEPHRGLRGMSSTPQPDFRPAAQFESSTQYRLSVPFSEFANRMFPEGGQKEFATVVRASDRKAPATADVAFRQPLLSNSWA